MNISNTNFNKNSFNIIKPGFYSKTQQKESSLPLANFKNQKKASIPSSLYKIYFCGRFGISQNASIDEITNHIANLYGKNDICELTYAQKKEILKAITKSQDEKFQVGDKTAQTDALLSNLPKDTKPLINSLLSALGISTKKFTEEQLDNFYQAINTLSSTLAKMKDFEFKDLIITQAYPKYEFIRDVLSILSDLPENERQKVYDYFGFELFENQNTQAGYTILGYPRNNQDNAKLEKITNEKTKKAIEALREKVLTFSENNPIKSNNPTVEEELNTILKHLPELQTTINRMQTGDHCLDVLRHSLKVMKKICENPNFDSLDPSDKKIILLSSLLHDITKIELIDDPHHNFESSLDAFYILERFGLSKDEQMQVYCMINYHEWLRNLNAKDIDEQEREKRIQNVAFDMKDGNLFKMSVIFTEADLKSVACDDAIFKKFGDALEKFSPLVKAEIAKLK